MAPETQNFSPWVIRRTRREKILFPPFVETNKKRDTIDREEPLQRPSILDYSSYGTGTQAPREMVSYKTELVFLVTYLSFV